MVKLIWNEHNFSYHDEKEALYNVLLIATKRVKYKSPGAIKEFLIGLCSMFVEIVTPMKNACKPIKGEHDEQREKRHRAYTTLIKKIAMFSKGIGNSSFLTDEKAVDKIYNLLLSLDGLTTLAGFGFSNDLRTGVKANAEKQSTVLCPYKESQYQKL